jgi:5S rRNA maturation endonuclease (ribonuclease M5)
LSTHRKEKVEKIEQILTQLIEKSSEGTPIIVEGKKDAAALQELGVKGQILTVKTGGKSFLEATVEIEKSSSNEVILFLDFDRRGQEGTKHLQESLEQGKILVNLTFWRKLRALAGREIQCVEGLPSYLITLQEKAT